MLHDRGHVDDGEGVALRSYFSSPQIQFSREQGNGEFVMAGDRVTLCRRRRRWPAHDVRQADDTIE